VLDYLQSVSKEIILSDNLLKEDALLSLVIAGILEQDGSYTDTYKELEKAGS
jgi:hypothetical protein